MKSWLMVVAMASMGCGGIVVTKATESDASTDVATSKKPADEPPSTSGSGTISPADASPVVDAVATPPDSEPPVTASCEDGVASGPPDACGSAGVACSGTLTDAVRAKLACYVDRCLKEMGRPPFCGKISLSFGSDGCTIDYLESSSASGCVKYQGIYRTWTCAVEKTIEIERPCP